MRLNVLFYNKNVTSFIDRKTNFYNEMKMKNNLFNNFLTKQQIKKIFKEKILNQWKKKR
jgi:hypothetical protein